MSLYMKGRLYISFGIKLEQAFLLWKHFLRQDYIKKVRCFKEKSSVLPLKGYYAGEEVLPDFCRPLTYIYIFFITKQCETDGCFAYNLLNRKHGKNLLQNNAWCDFHNFAQITYFFTMQTFRKILKRQEKVAKWAIYLSNWFRVPVRKTFPL